MAKDQDISISVADQLLQVIIRHIGEDVLVKIARVGVHDMQDAAGRLDPLFKGETIEHGDSLISKLLAGPGDRGALLVAKIHDTRPLINDVAVGIALEDDISMFADQVERLHRFRAVQAVVTTSGQPVIRSTTSNIVQDGPQRLQVAVNVSHDGNPQLDTHPAACEGTASSTAGVASGDGSLSSVGRIPMHRRNLAGKSVSSIARQAVMNR